MSKLFTLLTSPEKIDFFVNCQKLLLNNHPTSEFLLTKDNLEEKKYYALEFIKKYKGYCYNDENVCILYNKFKIIEPTNPKKELKDHIFKEPENDFNCVLIDFVVFRKMIDCLQFIKKEDESKIEYVLFVKNNEVKLYNKNKLLEKLNSPLINLLASF